MYEKLKNIINEEYKSIILEGLSDILYHYTYIDNLINILKENKFHASTNLGTGADFKKSKGKFFFFSMQRTKGKTGYGSRHGDVSIVLDGRKLMQRYKGGPIDYWEWSTDPKNWSDTRSYTQALQTKELEDRIFIDSPIIDNAISYIKEIHIFINVEKGRKDYPTKEMFRELLFQIKKQKVPTYFYNDKNDYQLQNKKKAVPPKFTLQPKDDTDYSGSRVGWFLKTVAPYIIINDKENKIKLFDLIDDYYKNKDIDTEGIKKSLEEKTKELQYYTYSDRGYTQWDDFRHGEKHTTVSSEIHNQKSNPDPLIRSTLKLMVNDIRKNKLKTLAEYMKFKLGVMRKPEKEQKPIFILWDVETNNHISWNKPFWNYIDKEDFWWKLLNDELREDLKYVEILNDDWITYKEAYKKMVQDMGKDKIVKFFRDSNIKFIKLDPDDQHYNFYKEHP